MKRIDHIYVGGQFVRPHGTETLELINPTTEQSSSVVTLGDEVDAQAAVAAAKAAYPAHARTTLAERGEMLQRLHDAVKAKAKQLTDAMVEEYGGPVWMSQATSQRAFQAFLQAKAAMEQFAFTRTAGQARVTMESLGVVALITPWNANASFICGKLAMAIAAGSTAVIKPSELSAHQTQVLTECLHAAALPPGVFNIVNGRGDVVGAAFTRHPDVAKISFTGSTAVGKAIARGAVDTLKRVTLELGGKSPNVLLDDADLATAIPTAISAAFMNSGQACIAGTRLLVPASRMDEVKRLVVKAVEAVQVGNPGDPLTRVGPMVTRRQYERVQGYIRLGQQEGATLLVGGVGLPAGLERGYFVRPTVFVDVTNDMRIAREEIFGPVLCIIGYETEADAVRIANDTSYGLQAYVSGSAARAQRVASQLVAGRVFVNGLYDEPTAPFGGFKQSGIGREFGTYGLEAYLEPKATMG